MMAGGAIQDAIGQMYGERATQGPAMLIAAGDTKNGVSRTRLIGQVLSPLSVSPHWQRIRGTMVFIPTHIDDVVEHLRNQRMEQMAMNFLTSDLGCDGDGDDDHQLWIKNWRGG